MEKLFRKTIAAIIGLDSDTSIALGGQSIKEGLSNRSNSDKTHLLFNSVAEIFSWCLEEGNSSLSGDPPFSDLWKNLLESAKMAKSVFCSYYSLKERRENVHFVLDLLAEKNTSAETKAKAVSEVWAPEIGMNENAILSRWKLSDVRPNPRPIQPTEVVLQLNGLYTLPADSSQKSIDILRDPGKKIADYDHPVHLFEKDEHHELINCLQELDNDLSFEKEQKVIPADYQIPVLLSVSVTHENLDAVCGAWILDRIRELDLQHMRVIVLSEKAVRTIKQELIAASDVSSVFGVYSVFGKYGVHFNALKYTQLLLESPYGIRAGFKIDTDEGIRSRDLFKATGKTWLTTLCHTLWGGTAVDWKGRNVELAFNLGEYMNEKDIDRLGYTKAMRAPDVSAPDRYVGSDVFFNKGIAHAKATALYNTFADSGNHLSHTVVKGGGYGITNEGLRSGTPFTFSLVGRAEDQQFYFSGLSEGLRGVFHPDLRIAHYKGAVASSEKKTEVSRFIGDMYRLIIFQHLVKELDVKEDIDPMPGVFAGDLARAQAFFHILYKALHYLSKDDPESAALLLREGWSELQELMEAIDSGEIRRQFTEEKEEWKRFTAAASSVESEKIRSILEQFVV